MAKLEIEFKSGEKACIEVCELFFYEHRVFLKFVRDVSGILQTDFVRLEAVSSFEISFESEDDKKMAKLKITKCSGEGQGSCKRCSDKGIFNRSWMCFLYRVEGLEGCYCEECAKFYASLTDESEDDNHVS